MKYNGHYLFISILIQSHCYTLITWQVPGLMPPGGPSEVLARLGACKRSGHAIEVRPWHVIPTCAICVLCGAHCNAWAVQLLQMLWSACSVAGCRKTHCSACGCSTLYCLIGSPCTACIAGPLAGSQALHKCTSTGSSPAQEATLATTVISCCCATAYNQHSMLSLSILSSRLLSLWIIRTNHTLSGARQRGGPSA